MNLHVGTSGYAYKEWKGSFYPKDLPASGFFGYYSERFSAVEINATFYRMPTPSVLTGWAEQAPNGFRYVLKAPQRITHFQRLKGSEESITFLANSLASLGDHRGPILFGLPPNFKKDVPRLRDFLRILEINTIGPIAFEFRNQSWFDDETFDLLRGYKAGAALCIAEAEGDLKVPFVSTAPWGYVRLRLPEYSTADLKAWLKDIRKQDWTEAYVFFKHEDGGLGPKFARQLLDVAEK